MTGYKGHGTKIYYNSDRLEVLSYDGISRPVWSVIDDPCGELADNKVPRASIDECDISFLKEKRREWGFSALGELPGTSFVCSGIIETQRLV